jgi:hypothetical protein
VTNQLEHVSDRVRAACASVAARAVAVRVADSHITSYARGLVAATTSPAPDASRQLLPGERDREDSAAFAICMDAINFGSGWWPTIRKSSGRSGYATMAAGVAARFRRHGRWSAAELAGMSAAAVAAVVGQDPAHPLMELYAAALRDVGEHVAADHAGSFARVAEAACGSATALADEFASWDAFSDTSRYGEMSVPFFKRAQLAAADLHSAGVVELKERERLTAFADNLVPHVLRLDGVLRLEAPLAEAIDAGRLLVHSSPEEVELRACAVHAVELLAQALDGHLAPADLDNALWNRGQSPRYKAVPRPRCRTTAY